jgi:hypothetical protein
MEFEFLEDSAFDFNLLDSYIAPPGSNYTHFNNND